MNWDSVSNLEQASARFLKLYSIAAVGVTAVLVMALAFLHLQNLNVEEVVASSDRLFKVRKAAGQAAESADRLNAPPNDIFLTNDTEREMKNLKAAQSKLTASLTKLEEAIEPTASTFPDASLQLELIRENARQLNEETLKVLQEYSKGDVRAAARLMAKADRNFTNIMNSVEDLSNTATDQVSGAILAHQIKNKMIQKVAVGILIGSVALAVLLVFLGLRLSKKMLEIDRTSREHRFVLDALRIGVWKYEPRSDILEWDKMMFEIYGLNLQDFGGNYLAWESMLSPEDKDRAKTELNAALAGEKEYDTSLEILTKTGDRRQIAAKGTVVRDSSGKPVLMYGINYDITPEFESQFEKEKLLKLLETILNNIPSTIFVKNQKDNFSYHLLNKPGEILFGVKSDHVIGRTDFDLFPKTTAREFRTGDLEVFATGQALHIHREYLETTRGHRILDTYRVPTFDARGKPDLIIGIANDITDDLNLKATLEAEQAKSIHNSKLAALGEMAGGIAHEINNPLAVIRGRAIQLQRAVSTNGFEPAQSLEILKVIVATSDRIGRIVSGLKMFSRSGEGDPMEPAELSKIVEDTLALCGEKFKTLGVNLDLKLEPHLHLNCRAVQISQVLLNLLSNALYAATHQNEKWVRLEARQTEDKILEISVTDSGLGIPEEILNRLMQPFFTTKPVGKGTGLGLSLSKGIVESHHGRLFYDRKSRHTRFVVQIPLMEHDEP